jgi:hypothetical protein
MDAKPPIAFGPRVMFEHHIATRFGVETNQCHQYQFQEALCEILWNVERSCSNESNKAYLSTLEVQGINEVLHFLH